MLLVTRGATTVSLAAALVLLALASTGRANALATSEQGFEFTFDGDLGGSMQDLTIAGGGVIEVICALTLLGSFHESTLSKESGADIGDITHAVVGPEVEEPCAGGTMSIHQETIEEPGWDVTYESFGGSLPDIDEVRVSLVGMPLI